MIPYNMWGKFSVIFFLIFCFCFKNIVWCFKEVLLKKKSYTLMRWPMIWTGMKGLKTYVTYAAKHFAIEQG